MATGGTPLARICSILVLAFTTALLVHSEAAAQESEALQKVNEGIRLLRIGDRESVAKAITVLREAIAADLTSEDALAALSQAEAMQALINLMASGAEGANVAQAILDIATPRLPEQAFNEAELKRLVKTAVESDDYNERFDASMSLARVYGEFAVPYLLPYLGSTNTEQKINAHITLMNRLGRDAVLPLNEALMHGNSTVRMMAASELGVIGDERSLAVMAEATQDADKNVRDEAAKAWEKLVAKFPWASGMTASELYTRLARLYYHGEYRVMAYADRPLVVWSWSDAIEMTKVPRYLYVLKLAEQACYDALRLDDTNMDARALLARVISTEKVASDAMSVMVDDELSKAYAAGLNKAAGTVAALGWDTLTSALTQCLDERDGAAGAFIVDLMPAIYSGADFTEDNPVVRGTTDSSAAVRLTAAESVLRFNATRRITAFPDPDGFIALVGRAVGQVIPRTILVVDANDARRNKMLAELAKTKYLTFDARSGGDGVLSAMRMVGLDLIILSVDLGDMDVLAAVRRLREDDRTKNVPIVIVGTLEQAADDQWRSLYKDSAQGLAGVPSGPGIPPPTFGEVVAAAFGGDSPGAKRRYEWSAQVLDALATTDTGNALFNWSALTQTLTMLLTADVPDDPPVRRNALRALANIADPAATGALISYFGQAADGALKAEAGLALAEIFHKAPQSLDDAAFDTLLKGTQSSDPAVYAAAFGALGSATLTPAQQVKCARLNRPGVGGTAGAEGGGEGCSEGCSDGCGDDGCGDDGCGDDGCSDDE